jgi:hypothetical protein
MRDFYIKLADSLDHELIELIKEFLADSISLYSAVIGLYYIECYSFLV